MKQSFVDRIYFKTEWVLWEWQKNERTESNRATTTIITGITNTTIKSLSTVFMTTTFTIVITTTTLQPLPLLLLQLPLLSV